MKKQTVSSTVTIAYIGGGSLNWAARLMGDLAYDRTLPAEVRLYDLDTVAARRNAKIGSLLSEASDAAVTYTVADSLQAALTDADFVVISILPGSLDDMDADIRIPERYGIAQSVGDTVGPGGFVRAMRAIPMLAEIGEEIRAHAPKAYVCNLTNPMSALTGALYAAFPDIRAWGECHEVTKLRHIVAWLANRRVGGIVHSFRDVEVNVLGINHFTFVDKAVVGGVNYLPAYLDFAREKREEGWRAAPIDPANEFQRHFEDHNKVKFDLACRFGIAAAAGDRHLAEFLPQSWYLDRHEAFGFGLTPVDFRRREQAEKRRRAKAMEAGDALPPVVQSEEALVGQFKALAGGPAHVSNVNLPNRGQVEGMPLGVVVETNARFSGLGVQPLFAGRLPAGLEMVVRQHAERQTALVAAVLEKRRNDLLPLFLSDPLVSPIGPDNARDMFGEMVEATGHLLPRALGGKL
ncbi:alpha-galactosidase [Corticibacterium sp. UT-5YL-CI-8]|nr:alpha-galactosidase [Tianweitania sp. UT-5YL-CI-8]